MVPELAACSVVLAVLGLGFYAVRKMRPGSFRLRTTLLHMFSFSMEIESSDAVGKMADGTKQGDGMAEAEGEASGLALPQVPSGEGG
jgi:hypothetical protein